MPAPDDSKLIAVLNDLLQLEHDALPNYALAIAALRDPSDRAAMAAFRDDHRRHVDELEGLIRDRGGLPLHLPHLPTGLFKLGVQLAGLGGGDRAVLLAFRANEWQSQAKYRRRAGDAAAGFPPDVAAFLARAADDETRHYEWASERLEALGAGSGTLPGIVNGGFARFHGTLADVIEAGSRLGLEALTRATRPG